MTQEQLIYCMAFNVEVSVFYRRGYIEIDLRKQGERVNKVIRCFSETPIDIVKEFDDLLTKLEDICTK